MKDTLDSTAGAADAGKTGREQRREPRRPAQGAVEVTWSDPVTTEVRGTLVDVSAGGFRMAHAFARLEAGQVVEFSHQDARGRARVVWTRIIALEVTGHKVESGFVVLDGVTGKPNAAPKGVRR